MLAKTKLNNIEVLCSKGLSNTYVSQAELFKVNNRLNEYHDINAETKNLKTLRLKDSNLFMKLCYLIASSAKKCRK